MTKKYSNINNKNKNRNTNNINCQNNDNVKFLMIKTLIVVIMEQLVIITKITVIKLTYRGNNMEKKKHTNKQT